MTSFISLFQAAIHVILFCVTLRVGHNILGRLQFPTGTFYGLYIYAVLLLI